MNDEKDFATEVANAWDELLAGIGEMPPFCWMIALATKISDKLTAAIERAT